MRLLEWLGLGAPESAEPPETDAIRRIAAELRKLEPDRARFVAAFAYLLGRVACADRQVTDEEVERMRELVARLGALSEAQAALVVEIARAQSELFAGTEDFLVARRFKELSDAGERRRLLACLFAVAAADGTITTDEEATIREIAEEIGLTHRDFVAARARFRDQRAVMRAFRREHPDG